MIGSSRKVAKGHLRETHLRRHALLGRVGGHSRQLIAGTERCALGQ
jgi:hypothetical protein